MWWIRAAMQEYILHSWSIVKMGTTAAQKKLFFNLRRLKRRLGVLENGELPPEVAKTIAGELDVPENEVVEMNRRLAAPTQSLNVPVRENGDTEWQDWLEDERESQEDEIGDRQEFRLRRSLLHVAMEHLTERERRILTERRLSETPRTLEELAQEYGISRERVRQIEAAAVLKLQKGVKIAANQRHLTL
jgi:RNA polymerase sigma-32 factor